MMMLRLAAVLLAGVLTAPPAPAQLSFPRVYGSTGHLYGPTQAHYQYQRQYGHPWHGYGGYTVPGYSGSTVVVAGYPGWGSPYVIGGPIVVSPFAPGLSFYSPGVIGGYAMYGTPGYYWPYPDHNLVRPNMNTDPQVLAAPLADALQDNIERWGPELPPGKPDPITLPVPESSPEAKLKSLRAIQDGDADLQRNQWLQAYADYKRAVQAAPDSAQAWFRQGLALTAVQHFDTAVQSFKRAVSLDPLLPQTGSDLESIFGPGSQIARNSMLLKVSDWVRQDVRNPDRLFLLGVLMHFERDPRAREVFEAGYRMAGEGQHLLAFLQPPVVADEKQPEVSSPQPADQSPALPLPPAPQPAQ